VLRIGLTGGIASGKSTVASLFAEFGVEIIDTDQIARELVVPGSPALRAIARAFGQTILSDDGALDRKKLRGIIFADAAKRRKLEAILHPLIREVALARADASDAPYVILAVPLLFETGFDRLVDRKLVVDCPEPLQIERLTRRDGVSAVEARAIIGTQMPSDARKAAADDVIDNSGDLESVRSRVAELHTQYLNLTQNCPNAQGRAE
jgi:dephospho-CoA kinase